MESAQLPIGVWHEKEKSRFRVRLYRNGKTYRGGYHKEESSAIAAWQQLISKLADIPRLRRGEKEHGIVPVASFLGLARQT